MNKPTMAKKPKTIPVPLTDEQLIDRAIAEFYDDYDKPPSSIQPKPTRMFVVGEQVRVGHLDEVFIERVLEDGMLYAYRCNWQPTRTAPVTVQHRVDWWFEIEKLVDTKNVPRLMPSYRQFSVSKGDIGSMFFLLRDGLVCDPEYQREYVWSEENKDALLDSVFERLDIGSFLLIRHAGFNHKNDSSLRTYRTLSGELTQIPKNEDYTIAIIDGQQRLTTIMDFVLDRRPYRGVYFSQMNPRDQHEFMGLSIQYTIINEEQVTRKEVLRMFLQSNRGVPQAPEHIAKVQALYNSLP